MDNSFNKNGTSNKQPDIMNSTLIRLPKNIRQVGSVANSNKVVYVEDYVMTFIKQLSDKEHAGCRIAVLLGHYIRTEDSKNIFIKGAVEMINADFNNGIGFTDEGWTSIYENIKKYFTDVEIVGWALVGPEFFIESGEKVRKVHIDNFPGGDKVLLKLDSMEKEEAFYLNENNQLIKQNGYYIYYEKNEEMQNYMVESKEEVVSEEQTYIDRTTPKIRSVIQEKKEVKEDKSVIRLLYSASTLLAIIVLVIATTMLHNYDQMKNLESAVNAISQNLTQVTQNSDQGVNHNQVAGSNGDSNSSNKDTTGEVKNPEESDEDSVDLAQTDLDDDSKDSNEQGESNNENSDETIAVETVSGNIKEEEISEDTDIVDDNQTNQNEASSEDAIDTQEATEPQNTKKEEAKPKDTSKTEDTTNKPEPETQPTSKEINYYVVKSGDSLVGICFKLYNSANNMKKIMELNGIEDENKIFAGQKLIVP